MANIDRPRGLQVYGKILRITKYDIPAAYNAALYKGDPVAGVAGGGINIATAGTGNVVLGAIVGFEEITAAKHLNNYNYYPASDAGTWRVLVADHPDQRFIMQEDSDGSNLALTERGANGNLVATAAGSTTTGLSGWEIDSSSFSGDETTAGDQLRLIDLLDEVNNAVGAHADWIVMINNHQRTAGIVGVGI